MEFIFRIIQYNADELVNEVALALEKQVELNSRKRLPDMWRFIDRLNSRRAPEGVLKKRAILRKGYGILLTGMGLFLLIPGMMEPRELLLPLIVGTISVVVGVGCVWPWRRRSNRRFHKVAEELLTGLRKPLKEANESSLLVRFTEEGMSLPNNSLVAYQDFHTVIETERIYFLVWQEKVTILQKMDLVEEATEAFLSFLEMNTGLQRITLDSRISS